MAQIHEEHVVLKLSRLVKDGEGAPEAVTTPEIKVALEELASQLLSDFAGGTLVVEVVSLGE